MPSKTEVWTVLLYPPYGSPRVVAIPRMPPEVGYPVRVFQEQNQAAAALEKFLNDNPEYRRWKDGRIVQEAEAAKS